MMLSRPRFYPDRVGPALRLALTDLLVLVWAIGWLLVGQAVHGTLLALDAVGSRLVSAGQQANEAVTHVEQSVAHVATLGANVRGTLDALRSLPHALTATGTGIIAAGQTGDGAVTAVQQAVANLPIVGGGLRDALGALHGLPRALVSMGANVVVAGHAGDRALAGAQASVGTLPAIIAHLRSAVGALHYIPNALIATGYDEVHAVGRLALTLGVAVAGIPLLLALLFYLPWRARKTRGFRSLDRLLRQPGAGTVPATLRVLAARALYTLPYDRLLRYSADPLGEWNAGRYDNLARATLDVEGLDLRRYLRRVERDAAPVYHHALTASGDERETGI